MQDYLLHGALVVGGFVGSHILQATWKYLSDCFSIGFKEGTAERLKLGRDLTPEEKIALKRRVEQKLAEQLDRD
jgi:hypothetical protein